MAAPFYARRRAGAPLLIWMTRDLTRTAASYIRRGAFGGDQDKALAEIRNRHALAAEQFARWPWSKLHLDYDQAKAAAALFDVTRG